MGAAEKLELELEIESIGKNEDALNIYQACHYLASIGFPVVPATLRNRLSLGTGPARVKRMGRNFFRKSDLDAWKKNESQSFSAYSR